MVSVMLCPCILCVALLMDLFVLYFAHTPLSGTRTLMTIEDNSLQMSSVTQRLRTYGERCFKYAGPQE